jgi:hypothetical protein
MTSVELPKFEFQLLSDKEKEIVENIYMLSFDQAGCRMIQQILEEMPNANFVSALVQGMSQFLPEVMCN